MADARPYFMRAVDKKKTHQLLSPNDVPDGGVDAECVSIELQLNWDGGR